MCLSCGFFDSPLLSTDSKLVESEQSKQLTYLELIPYSTNSCDNDKEEIENTSTFLGHGFGDSFN